MPMTDEEIQAFVTRTIQGAVAPLGEQMRGITTSLAEMRVTPAPPVVPPTPAPVPPVVPPVTAPVAVDPALNSQILEFRRSNEKLVADMAALQKEREAERKRADDAERLTAVTSAMSGFQFATDAARQTAVEKLLPQIKRTDTGALVAGDNLTPEAFIKDFLPTQHAYLLAPVNTGGSGVTPGSHGVAKAVDLNSISPSMSADGKAAAWDAVRTTLGSLGR